MKKIKESGPKHKLTAEDKLNIRRMKQGWTLHRWTMTSPHNWWLQGKRSNSQENFTSSEGRFLLDYFKEKGWPLQEYNSKDKVPEYNIGFGRGSDCGMSRHTIWSYNGL